MKFNPFLNFRLLISFLILSACSTGRITISVLEPAEISIPVSIQKVSIFPGAGIPDPPGQFDSIDDVHLKPKYNYQRTKRGYSEGIYEMLSKSPRFQRVMYSDTSFESFLNNGVISWDQIREICIHDSTDALLLLKKAVTRDLLNRENVEGGYLIYYNLLNQTKWSFFQPFLLEESEDIIYSDFNNYTLESNNYEVENIPGILYDACYNTGIRLGEMLCPAWHDDVRRILFSGPGKPLKQAFFLATHNQWNQAGSIWNELSNSENPKQASRASFNLALTWEQDDNLDQALLWIGYADSLQSTKRTHAYKKILTERLKKKAELDLQMDGK